MNLFSKIALTFCFPCLALFQTGCMDAGYDRIPERIDGYAGINLFIFHASWCGYCNMELPALKKLYAEYAPCGVHFMGVNEDDSKEIMEAFVQKMEIPYPVVHWDYELMKKFGHPRAIPSHFLIDSTGKVVLREIGPIDPQKLRTQLDKTLGESLKGTSKNCFGKENLSETKRWQE